MAKHSLSVCDEDPNRIAVIRRSPGETTVALVENQHIVEIHVFRDHRPWVGSIIRGRVHQILAGGRAALLDIGADDPALLSGMVPSKGGQGAQGRVRLSLGSMHLVQVTHESRRDKGVKVSLSPSVSGSLMALLPCASGITFPKGAKECSAMTRLRKWADRSLNVDEGVVFRPASFSADEHDLNHELLALRQRVQNVHDGGVDRPCVLATVLAGRSVNYVVCDSAQLALQMRKAGWVVDVHHRSDDLLSLYGFDDVLSTALSSRVPLPGGGNLWIEHTAALTAIDVDSGGHDPQLVNQKALAEIARHMRLRALSGMIVIDFIAQVAYPRRVKKQLAADLAVCVQDSVTPTEVLGVSALGLVEVRRRRSRPSLNDLFIDSVCAEGSPTSAEACALDALRNLADHVLSCAPFERQVPTLHVSSAIHALFVGSLSPAVTEFVNKYGITPALQVVPGTPSGYYVLN